ncbi:M48 family metallopeptidase [Pseudoduganella sp. OTU4001]|uniref:M48 family metallopeptidase n=1 Tax=Pseudoduganella sp. OTU4001 TaxID=3043854 RepID=UPI00313C6176
MLAGRYFDGKTSRLHRVTLTVSGDTATLSGDVERSCALRELRVSERSAYAVRKVTFPDEACFEPDDRAAFDALLDATGHRDSVVVRMQRSWRMVLAAFAGTVAVMVPGYLYGLPLAADYIAQAMPASVERKMGQGLLELMDKRVLQPSEVDAARRQRIAASFAALQAPHADAPSYQLQFRKGNIGPNAFAMPSGDIVLTDELVNELSDGAVLAVLAHELGHLHRRHMSRRIIQGSVVAATGGLMFGDVNGMVSTASAMLLDLNYSRDAENEADDYAADMLLHNGLPLRQLEQVFELLSRERKGPSNAYLSTHPLSEERLARLRQRGR